MPSRKRNYKQEYQRAKARAHAAGYRSVREYQAVRKELKLPRNASPISKRSLELSTPGITTQATRQQNSINRMRKASREWAKKHSRVTNSQFNSRWDDQRVRAYNRAFVEPIPEGEEKNNALYNYLVEYELVDPKEWTQLYAGTRSE